MGFMPIQNYGLELWQKMKNKKVNFIWDQEGHKGERDEICFAMHFCVCKPNLLLTSQFFSFWNQCWFCNSKIRILEVKCIQRNQIYFLHMNYEDLIDWQVFFGSRWRKLHLTDSMDKLWICD